MSFIMRAKITYRPRLTARLFREIAPMVNRAGGLYWLGHFLPKHFETRAAGPYGYKPRITQEEKEKRRGYSPLALVKTGDTARQAKASRQGVRGFPSRTRIELYTPDYIPQKPRRRKMPHMAAEIFKILPGEQRQIERAEQQYAEKQLRRRGRPHTVRIG
ncbi:MAG: hypothetical protein ACYSWU_19410 [Planctomycetota bacterium]|jgi:hypothetical protein